MFGKTDENVEKSSNEQQILCVVKEAAFKIETPKDFGKLDVVIGSKKNCFSDNYTNYFSRLIKSLNEYYSFNFYCDFIKKIIAEEIVLHCLRLKQDVQ